MPGPEPESLARDIVSEADRLFPKEARPEFSGQAYREFVRAVETYVSDLLEETYRETRTRHADRITPEYVRAGADRVTTHRRGLIVTFGGSLGGIFLGAAVASLPAWLAAPSIDPRQAAVTLVLSIAGAALFFSALVYELSRR